MHQQYLLSSNVALAADDLDLLQKFLDAWCDENSVDPANEAASDVAAALIDWYQHALSDRNLLKAELPGRLPQSPELELLLRQLAEA